MYIDFFVKSSLKSFQMLREQHDFVKQDFFRFLQLRHHIDSIFSKDDLGKLGSGKGILGVFISAYRAESGSKTISKLYKGLQELRGVNTSYIKKKWESEGNFVLTTEEWENLHQKQWKSTNSLSWREFNWKNMIRYFITPVQQSRLRQAACWRGCGAQKANHYHVFWDCIGIAHYWETVRDSMEKVLKVKIDSCFQVLYLGMMPQQILGFSKAYLFRVMLVASKKAITKKWLSQGSPTLTDWFNVMHDIFVMEKLTFFLRLKTDTFNKCWKGWIDFINPYRADFT